MGPAGGRGHSHLTRPGGTGQGGEKFGALALRHLGGQDRQRAVEGAGPVTSSRATLSSGTDIPACQRSAKGVRQECR
jgi:hypothetical protein